MIKYFAGELVALIIIAIVVIGVCFLILPSMDIDIVSLVNAALQ